jgi:hypothetical protein
MKVPAGTFYFWGNYEKITIISNYSTTTRMCSK